MYLWWKGEAATSLIKSVLEYDYALRLPLLKQTSYGYCPNRQGQQQQTQKEQPQQQTQGMGGLYAAAELLGKRRDSYAGHEHGAPYSAHTASLPHPSKAYAPGFFPVPPTLQTPVGANGGGGKMGMGMGMGSGSGSPTRGGGYGGGGGFAGSPPAFQINRYQSRHAQTQPISRSAREHRGEEFDALHDLNGTLASLDLVGIDTDYGIACIRGPNTNRRRVNVRANPSERSERQLQVLSPITAQPLRTSRRNRLRGSA
ncbi:hypothetical protein B0H13DRAFT_2463143 [Mycena leptocephala]|nr:hypothetical protein B0H13DRAFT_2463143 [Mycena leptocephala]